VGSGEISNLDLIRDVAETGDFLTSFQDYVRVKVWTNGISYENFNTKKETPNS
jgi:hypothetical protein